MLPAHGRHGKIERNRYSSLLSRPDPAHLHSKHLASITNGARAPFCTLMPFELNGTIRFPCSVLPTSAELQQRSQDHSSEVALHCAAVTANP